MQCPRCSAMVVAAARFCPVCGQSLAAERAAQVVDIAGVPRNPVDSSLQMTVTVQDGDRAELLPPRASLPGVPEPLLRTQWQRWWWKLLVLGTGLYLLINRVTVGTENVLLLPQLFLIGTFLVPIVYIAYLYEDGTLYDVSLPKIGLVFFFGGVCGTLAASLLEARLITGDGRGLFGQLSLLNASIVSLSEELAKLIVLLPFLFVARRSYPTVMHGIVLGAAAGMGFAALESMGYAFAALISSGDLNLMHSVIRLRSLLAPLGHGTWTAIIAAAVWREQTVGSFPINRNVLVAFLTAVGLHLLWDYLPVLSVGGLPFVQLILGLIGLLVLRFFLLSAKGDQGAAYRERNLTTGLRIYARELRHDVQGLFGHKQGP